MSRPLFFALAGQPNCGKSTLFNAVAGYKAVVSNFPGTTVEYTQTHIHFMGREIDLIDLPGIYSLSMVMDKAEEETLKFFIHTPPDVVINVIDSSVLSRSLEFTLELIELRLPMVLCLNMIDEAEKKGIEIDETKLEEVLGIPAIKTVALKGRGVREVFATAIKVAEEGRTPKKLDYYLPALREIIDKCENLIKVNERFRRFFAVEILSGNQMVEEVVALREKEKEEISSFKSEINELTGNEAREAIVKERHAFAMNIFEKVARIRKGSQRTLENRIDSFLLTGWRGYMFTLTFFFLLLFIIFFIGANVEEVLMGPFELLSDFVQKIPFPLMELVEGLLQGVAGGVAIVMPYLLPLIFFLSYSEDIGILPRVAFVFDNVMHRIGLHGKSVIPLIMGYGCSVPAVIGTRILESQSERKRVAYLSTLIPCSARTTVILATVGLFAGFKGVIVLYMVNLMVVAGVSKLISARGGEAPGLIIEIPPYRIPPFRMTLAKTWLRLKDFVVRAWPILIVGSVVLSLAEVFGIEKFINYALSPLTSGLLGLPESVGITLIFGLLRKELAMLMLFQALGTMNISEVMSFGQIMTLAVFITFYIPCVATLYYMGRDFGGRFTVLTALLSTAIATILGIITRLLFSLWG